MNDPSRLSHRGFTASALNLSAAPMEPASIESSTPVETQEAEVTRFEDFVERGRLSKTLVATLPFETCTEVQARTLDPILDGGDVLARAKTGTGKTMAFLLPAIQNHLEGAAPLPAGSGPTILVLSPTRELAMQIQKQAMTLKGKATWESQVFVGGTSTFLDKKRLNQGRTDVLVATPGRLLDHLQNGDLRRRLQNLKCLVLDEADRLLDAGFEMDLKKIVGLLPKQARQTLLFSATLSPEVREVAKLYLTPDHTYVSTVTDNEVATHEHVDQGAMIVPMDQQYATLAALVSESYKENRATKIICFLPTARQTALAAAVLQNLQLPVPVFDIHSRKTQSQRTRTHASFTKASSGILLSSDVTARGIDIPNITAVYQVGCPTDAEQYTHRLGRTARAGKEGEGLLILDPFEATLLKHSDFAKFPLVQAEPPTDGIGKWQPQVQRVLEEMDPETKDTAYKAWIGYYKGTLKYTKFAPSDHVGLIRTANLFSEKTLLYGQADEPKTLPPFSQKLINAIGFRRDAAALLNVSNYVKPSSTDRNTEKKPRWNRDDSSPRDRSPRVDRPPHSDRPPRSDRPAYADRPPRSDRPSYSDRPPRGDRPSYGDRPPRSDRPRTFNNHDETSAPLPRSPRFGSSHRPSTRVSDSPREHRERGEDHGLFRDRQRSPRPFDSSSSSRPFNREGRRDFSRQDSRPRRSLSGTNKTPVENARYTYKSSA